MTRQGLAVVSPIPPARTGIADYTWRLLPHLADLWDVTVVVADEDPQPTAVPDQLRVVTASEWRWAQRAFGARRMLICLGNSGFHLHVPELCKSHGGVVLAHDVRMTGFHCLRALGSPDRHYLSTIVEERYGPELATEIRSMEDRAPIAESFSEIRRRLEDANALLLGAAVPGASAVCVHSRLAARLASLDLHGSGIPVSVVPFALPCPWTGARRPVEGRVSSFGMVEPEKQPALLVEALAVLRGWVPNATLRLVGPLGGGMHPLLESTAKRLGVLEAVSWTDRVIEADYREELAQAAVAAQLRSIANGETSAATADCLSAGIPTLVSAIGSQAELPTSAALHVPAGADAYEIASSLRTLLLDRSMQTRLTRAARQYARSSTFPAAAGALTELLLKAPAIRY